MRISTLRCVFTFLLLSVLSLGLAISSRPSIPLFSVPDAQAADVQYLMDPLGRLKAVVDSATNQVAVYTYDETGNVRSIVHQSASQLSIIDLTPHCGVGNVTIAGTGFHPTASTVTIAGQAVAVVSATATQIVAQAPASGMGPVTVTVPGGSTTSSDSFTAGACGSGGAMGPPSISSFSPAIGTPGTTVVNITGTYYSPELSENRVAFNKYAFAPPTAATPTTVTATLPLNATTGHLSVTTPFGTGVSAGVFFIPPAPFTVADVQVMDTMTLNSSKTVTISSATKIALVAFDGNAGQRVSLAVSGSTLGTTGLSVYKPDGIPFFGATYEPFVDTLTLPLDGTYTIPVDPDAVNTGQATLTLHNVPADFSGTVTLNNATPLSVPITTPGQNAAVTFSATAGQKVTVKVTANTICKINVDLYSPSGTYLTGVSKTSCTTSFNLPQKTASVTGTYTVSINPVQALTGSLSVRVTNP